MWFSGVVAGRGWSADRLAAALVVLYAQPLARIVALTTDHVQTEDDEVTVALGRDRLRLPEPFAALARQVPRHRRVGPAAQLRTPWLFPSTRADRHTTATTLARRLQRLGIDPCPMRHAALIQLAAELPPVGLAHSLGINITTATGRTRLANGNWTAYVASRARTTHPATVTQHSR